MGLPPELADRFDVLRELKAGGEADLLLVAGSDRNEVVLKLYRPGIIPNQEMWDTVRAVDSPFVVRLIESGESDFRAYEIMEYLAAGSLCDLMQDTRRGMDTSTIVDVVRQVTLGLGELHGYGIIHRDLKPGNILIRSLSPLELALADFGLCRNLERTTVFSMAGNTLAYAAPESLSGHVSPARDWWSLGMIVRELATGEPPFADLSPEEVTLRLTSRLIDCSNIADERLQLLCRGLLVREPEERWGAEEVGRWLAGESPEVRDSGQANRAYTSRRNKIISAAILIALFALFAAGRFAFMASSEKTAAKLQHATALSRQAALESLTVTDPRLAALLAEAAYQMAPTIQARGVMVTAFARESMTTLPLTALNYTVASLAISSDGRILATASTDGTARLWNLASLQPIGSALPGAGTHIGFSPNGEILATASTGGTAKLWNLASHQPISSALPGAGVIHMAFSPNGEILATADTDRTVQLWDVATDQRIGAPLRGAGTTAHMAFSLNSRVLATASKRGIVRLWDVATRRQIGSALPGTGVIHLGFSPNGRVLATASTDGTVRLWDVATHGQKGAPLKGAGLTAHVAFSPDGKVLVTASIDGTVRLWNVATHQQMGSALTDAGITHMAFSLNDKFLATVGAGHSVQIWRLPTTTSPVRLSIAICATSRRGLSYEEWKHYLPGAPYQTECPVPR